MESPKKAQGTGNPVFDYKIEYRVAARSLQTWIFRSGMLLIIGGAITAIVGPEFFQIAGAILAGMGVLMIAGCVWWAFHWRKKLREDFRKEYGGGN